MKRHFWFWLGGMLATLLGSATTVAGQDGPLHFAQPLTVFTTPPNAFTQLESSGRRLIALSGETVAVSWTVSDVQSSSVLVAFRLPHTNAFTPPVKISGLQLAYEPNITGLSDGRFLIAWEEDQKVWLRIISPMKNGARVQLGNTPAQQVSVDANQQRVAATWAEGKTPHIFYAELQAKGMSLAAPVAHSVDQSADRSAQLYPAVELTAQGSVVAWEDRRLGVTRIASAFAPYDKPFAAYHLLNPLSHPPNRKYGRGSGSMRVALSGSGDTVLAAWLDKRNWRSGYDVFASQSTDGGETFGVNEQAQDMFGDNQPQWHPSVAMHGNATLAVAVWDDARNESPDVFYSLREDDAWGDDIELPGGDGPGKQSHPSIIFDRSGRLHVVWLTVVKGVTQLRYTYSDAVQ